ncbi:MAG: carboxymuconolactone decarboxylase family protein [Comamonadaceae bacterium]|nr:carboxymuconolactone decarboxylase family protein [Comamonadaceae bacterium]
MDAGPADALQGRDRTGQEVLDEAQQQVGFIPNMYANMVHSPGLLETYLHGYNLFRTESGFSRPSRKLFFSSVSAENGCTYCVAAHSVLADVKSKLAPEVTDAIRNATAISDPKLRALSEFTRVMVATRGWPSASAVDAFLCGRLHRAPHPGDHSRHRGEDPQQLREPHLPDARRRNVRRPPLAGIRAAEVSPAPRVARWRCARTRHAAQIRPDRATRPAPEEGRRMIRIRKPSTASSRGCSYERRRGARPGKGRRAPAAAGRAPPDLRPHGRQARLVHSKSSQAGGRVPVAQGLSLCFRPVRYATAPAASTASTRARPSPDYPVVAATAPLRPGSSCRIDYRAGRWVR